MSRRSLEQTIDGLNRPIDNQIMSNLKTVTHDFPLPDSSTAIVFDFFEMLHRQALTGTNELIRNYVQQSIVNGRPDNSLCLSRDAKFMLSPVFYTSEPGTKRKRLPAAGDVLKATSFINFVGRSYYQNQTIFSYAERKEDKARGRWDPESFEPGEVIAAATLGFVFVTTTESGGWKASKCPEELVEGGWVVSSWVVLFAALSLDVQGKPHTLSLSPIPNCSNSQTAQQRPHVFIHHPRRTTHLFLPQLSFLYSLTIGIVDSTFHRFGFLRPRERAPALLPIL